MSSFQVRLRKKNPGGGVGKVLRTIGPYPTAAAAKAEAQALADKRTFRSDVQLTVEGVGARKANGKKRTTGRKRNPTSRRDLDPQQEVLFDTLKLIAENDGTSFPHAVTAVDAAWRDYRRERDQNEREDFRVIRDLLIKTLLSTDAGWKRTNGRKKNGLVVRGKGRTQFTAPVAENDRFTAPSTMGPTIHRVKNPKLTAAGHKTILGHHVTGKRGAYVVHPYGKSFGTLVAVRAWLKGHVAESR